MVIIICIVVVAFIVSFLFLFLLLLHIVVVCVVVVGRQLLSREICKSLGSKLGRITFFSIRIHEYEIEYLTKLT